MADDLVQIRVEADPANALAALGQVRQAVAAVAEPAMRLKASFGEADAALRQMQASAAAMRRSDTAALAAFKATMETMVAARKLSASQAIGFEIDYTAQLNEQERARAEAVLANTQASVDARIAAFRQLFAVASRYNAGLVQDQKRLADAASREAARFAEPFREAFDEIGAGMKSALAGLLDGTETYRSAALNVVRSIERSVVGLAGTVASKAAAGPLGSLLGVGAQPGEGVGDVLGAALGRWVFGMPQQLGQPAALAANTTAVAANTSAVAALTAAMGTSVAAGGAAAAGLAGGAAAGAEAGGGGFLGGLFGFLGFARGGVVPSAARGWALPKFPGAVPALLHSREMVLPAPISEGLQDMIGRGGGGDAHFHAHFHGPADAPAIARWFRDNMRANAGAIRDAFRSNALTPRNF